MKLSLIALVLATLGLGACQKDEGAAPAPEAPAAPATDTTNSGGGH